MNLNNAVPGKEYTIKQIKTEDEELRDFLLTLGCFEGGKVTVVSEKRHNVVLAVRDGRYSIDRQLAETVLI